MSVTIRCRDDLTLLDIFSRTPSTVTMSITMLRPILPVHALSRLAPAAKVHPAACRNAIAP